jgi:hypothetical protein
MTPDDVFANGLVVQVDPNGQILMGWKADGKLAASVVDVAGIAEIIPRLIEVVHAASEFSGWERAELPGPIADGLGLPVTGLSIASAARDGAMRICVQVGPTDLYLDFPVEAARRIGYALLTASAAGRPI